MALIRPRLTDYYGIPLAQEHVDFAIPYLDEDLPFGVDPFLLWRSPSQQDNGLHQALVQAVNHLGHLFTNDKADQAVSMLVALSECAEVGLGFSGKRQGRPISEAVARQTLGLFSIIPQLSDHGFSHIEEIQLLVKEIGPDRISDITCSVLKSFLIDYTAQECRDKGIPTNDVQISGLYHAQLRSLATETVQLPTNPETNQGVLLVPKRWLRKAPWITSSTYNAFYLETVGKDHAEGRPPTQVEILTYSRHNYEVVSAYVAAKERDRADCRNDPLFSPLSAATIAGRWSRAKKLPTGKTEGADRKYEDLVSSTLATLMYPHLDFANAQSRTDSGAQIRDVIFYNTRSKPLLEEIWDEYHSHQIVFELKNVASVSREHVNQLNRYMTDSLGKFGVLVTRHPPSRAIRTHLVDLWSGQRKCIVVLTDEELDMMVSVAATKSREPLEVLNKAYVEFRRRCPV